MKRYSTYISAALIALLSTACIRQKEEFCPPEVTQATVRIEAEKFLARPPYDPSEVEESFNTRIHSLSYRLYGEDGNLIRQGKLDQEAAATASSAYTLQLDDLPYDSYSMELVANTPEYAMSGDTDSPGGRSILYQREGNGEDNFAIAFPLEVRNGEDNSFDAVLHRLHGVTKFRFENIPDNISAVEVTLTNVAARSTASGRYDLPIEVTKRMDVKNFPSREQAAFAVGTFATVPGTQTSWRLRLYASDEAAPLYDGIAAEGLLIEGNQLLELGTRFPEGGTGDLEFTVNMNTQWDGSTEGGGTIIIK